MQEQVGRRVPLWIKLPYTAFVAVLVPVYWVQYGPLNFLYFCDVALLLTTVALWTESSLLASMPAVGIVLPQLLWVIDFFCRLLTGVHPGINLTEYMFDPSIPLYARALSSFHGWLPILLVWLVWRLGYDRRALLAQIALGWTVLVLSFLLVPYNDPKRAGNVNKVFGWDDESMQPPIAPLLWLGALMLGHAVLIYLPSHFLFRWLMPAKSQAAPAGKTSVY
jgi:hypothetical protein